jgi:hypothetical protein
LFWSIVKKPEKGKGDIPVDPKRFAFWSFTVGRRPWCLKGIHADSRGSMTDLPKKLQALFARRFLRAFSAILCGLAVLAAIFLYRRPVVLVTDSAFTALYGKQRGAVKKLSLSALLFRRVKTAPVAENAGPDLVSLAARAASKRPYAVFFPYRYRDGALRYTADYPDVPAAVLGGREKPPGTPAPEPAWYSTDVLTDLYRGGFCAGLLAAGRAGDIIVFQVPLDREQRAALLKGVEESAGAEKTASVRFTDGDFSGEAACAVLAGGGEAFFREHTDIPFILYSWLDPAAAPSEAAVIFSDSPWEVLPQALSLLEKGRLEGIIPSIPLFSGYKTADMSPVRIKKIIFFPESADN